MGILDEAIREHIELKRQHGAGDSELKQLEDEAFGQAERPGDERVPDTLAEAPTEFMAQPETAEETGGRREPSIADLQEPPPPREPVRTSDDAPAEEPAPAKTAIPAEEHAAMEHEVVAEAPAAEQEAPAEVEAESEPAAHSTEERKAVGEQPTELFDIEEEIDGPPSPTNEELIEEEIAEPRLAPADPLASLEETEEAEVSVQGPAPDDDDEYDDEDDAFWNEQRLSDELDQALEAPVSEPEAEPEQEEEPEPAETLEAEEEAEPVAELEPSASDREDDVLEETPDFLEETPEDDQLWFEQKPPKDFDFDD